MRKENDLVPFTSQSCFTSYLVQHFYPMYIDKHMQNDTGEVWQQIIVQVKTRCNNPLEAVFATTRIKKLGQ